MITQVKRHSEPISEWKRIVEGINLYVPITILASFRYAYQEIIQGEIMLTKGSYISGQLVRNGKMKQDLPQ